MEKTRIFLDLEYLYPGMTREKGRPGEKEKRQIVQIAAIRTGLETGKEYGSFDIFCIPAYTRELPEFFIELTNITQVQVEEEGQPFPEAILKLSDFCQDDPIWTFDADYGVLKQNATYFNIELPFKEEFIRVKPLLKGWGLDYKDYSSGTLYKATGAKLNGHVHNALHDVRSMSLAVNFFEK